MTVAIYDSRWSAPESVIYVLLALWVVGVIGGLWWDCRHQPDERTVPDDVLEADDLSEEDQAFLRGLGLVKRRDSRIYETPTRRTDGPAWIAEPPAASRETRH